MSAPGLFWVGAGAGRTAAPLLLSKFLKLFEFSSKIARPFRDNRSVRVKRVINCFLGQTLYFALKTKDFWFERGLGRLF